jgi:hypothetical protein
MLFTEFIGRTLAGLGGTLPTRSIFRYGIRNFNDLEMEISIVLQFSQPYK